MTYEQDFDAENRLAVVTNTVTGDVTAFTYDGDGARVKKVDPTGATSYVGGYYEEFRPALRTWTFTGQVQAGG
ncbi:MAG: hypothetical protein KKB13_06220, partial [Chloroflexi bacterium]|nr:hypothetical protein [Chloroflexota bacterium]